MFKCAKMYIAVFTLQLNDNKSGNLGGLIFTQEVYIMSTSVQKIGRTLVWTFCIWSSVSTDRCRQYSLLIKITSIDKYIHHRLNQNIADNENKNFNKPPCRVNTAYVCRL